VCLLLPNYAEHRIRRLERTYKADRLSILDALAWVQAVLKQHNLPIEPFVYTLESTACYHLPIVLAWGGRPAVVNPVLAAPSRRKTDILDARLLAYHCLTGLWPTSWVPPPAIQELRALARARRASKQAAHRRLLSIGSMLLAFGYTFTAEGSIAKNTIRPLVEDLIARRPPLTAEAKKHLTGTPLPEPICRLIKEAYAAWDEGQNRAGLLQREILKGARALQYPGPNGPLDGQTLLANLLTVPGVGDVTGTTWLLEIGDVTRFANCKACVAYAGFDPSVKVSAGKTTSHVRRKGNAKLHHTLVQAAQSVLQRQAEPIGIWGAALRKRHAKGGYQKAVGAVARRIVIGCYWVHLRNEPFSYAKYKIGVPCPSEKGPNLTSEGPKPKRPNPPPEASSSSDG
jgi:transposase